MTDKDAIKAQLKSVLAAATKPPVPSTHATPTIAIGGNVHISITIQAPQKKIRI